MFRKLLAVLLIVLIFAVSASADVLWEPYDNDYYNKAGYENFRYMDHTYVVPDGMTASLYKSPKTGGLIKIYASGTRLYIGPYAEINGEVWAAGYAFGDNDYSGWVRLNRLQREYSTEAFMQDYAEPSRSVLIP